MCGAATPLHNMVSQKAADNFFVHKFLLLYVVNLSFHSGE